MANDKDKKSEEDTKYNWYTPDDLRTNKCRLDCIEYMLKLSDKEKIKNKCLAHMLNQTLVLLETMIKEDRHNKLRTIPFDGV